MKLMEEEDEAEQNKLRADIERLEQEVEQYRDQLTQWIDRCRGLENELTLARKGQASTDAIPLRQRDTSKQDGPQPMDVDSAIGCGNCSADTRCQCLDEAFSIMNAADGSILHEKRPHSPSQATGAKRLKTEPNEEQETDFTAMFASRPPPKVHHDSTDHVDVVSIHSGEQDPCGFCSDGTPCICAQMAAEDGKQHASLQHTISSNTTASLPHQLYQQGFTPPPSEGDVSTSLPSRRAPTTTTANPCASGPGTCAQCRADPNSTLFCKSLAASRLQSSSTGTSALAPTPAGCCNSTGAIASSSTPCCRSTRSTRSNPQPASQSHPAPDPITTNSNRITLSCADAYTTLSRHPGYSRAQGEMAGWMGKLLPVPVFAVAREGEKAVAATAMEIDAANVMTVLREFDRRFTD